MRKRSLWMHPHFRRLALCLEGSGREFPTQTSATSEWGGTLRFLPYTARAMATSGWRRSSKWLLQKSGGLHFPIKLGLEGCGGTDLLRLACSKAGCANWARYLWPRRRTWTRRRNEPPELRSRRVLIARAWAKRGGYRSPSHESSAHAKNGVSLVECATLWEAWSAKPPVVLTPLEIQHSAMRGIRPEAPTPLGTQVSEVSAPNWR